MKTRGTTRWIAALLFLLCINFSITNSAKAQGGPVSFQTFYDELSPYGQWIDDPNYGYVWAPNSVGSDFRPYYSNGQWAMTEYGNTWVSNYDWGWAPFHYGRWTYDPYYNWVWIPGNTWGPAWVSWRHGGGNFGWAPLGPGVGINISIGNWFAPNDWWCFTPQRYIYSGGYNRYWNGPRNNNTYINNTTIINNTTVINNNTYVYGPRRDVVERATGQRVNVYNIRNERNPQRTAIRNNSVSVYRPRVASTERTAAAPRNVVQRDNNRASIAQRNNGNVRALPSERTNAVRPTERNNGVLRGNDMREQRPTTQRLERADNNRDANIRERMNSVRSSEVRQAPQRDMAPARREIDNSRQQMEAQRLQRNNDRTQQVEAQRLQQNNERQQMRQQQDQQRNQRMADMQRQRESANMQRQEMNRQRMEQRQQNVQQREWRRPEPQMQRQPQQQRMERPQMQRSERPAMQQRPQMQRMERPQMQRSAPSQRVEMQRGGGGEPRGRR